MFDLKDYDAFEVHPVVALDETGTVVPRAKMHETVVVEVEQCDDDAVDIYSWGVYGHIPHEPRKDKVDRGGIFCLADCPDRETAEFFQGMLYKAIGIVIEP